VERVAFVGRPASPGRGGALFSDHGGGRHLAAGHAVDSVVHEKDSDVFAAVGGVHDFGGADGCEIAVSLIGDDDSSGTGAFDGGCRGRGATVSDLDVTHVKVVIRKDRAADGTDEDRFVLHPQFLERFGNQLVGDAVAATGAVVGLMLQFRLALVEVIEQGRAGVDFFVCVGLVLGSTMGFASGVRSTSTLSVTFDRPR